MSAKYAIGIDLGTTNSVLAYAPLGAENPQVQTLPIPQLVAVGSVESRGGLPSFLYVPLDNESGDEFRVPGILDANAIVGEFARRKSADAPMRTVAAAKSWLAHSRVDRRQPILPWNAPEGEVKKISPVEAATRYLKHLVAAWEAAHPDAPFRKQHVVLTVPASFDASARELTREAALAAGLPADFTLLEEPQAAVYAWLADEGERWRRTLKLGDVLLVCDVGGGTTDFTLIEVGQRDGDLVLERKAVGNHVLVGGDNMDAALAHTIAQDFAEKKVTLDPWQSVSLWHACRAAKETLLAADGPKAYPVSVAGRGSKLIAKSVSVDLARERVLSLLLDGFFPPCAASERPQRRRMSGFQEIGLPFEADAAITRHLAAFLSAHGAGEPVHPTHVLFNGGVFKSDALRTRLMDVVGSWASDGRRPTALDVHQNQLDESVARGAAYYASLKTGKGVRIRGGVPRTYYVGIETAGLAVPGAPRPLRALCVVPFGMEEGTQIDVPSGEIGLIVGEPAAFRFFSSATRKDDQPGALVSNWSPEEIEETDSLETTLPPSPEMQDEYVPVRFQSRITELGVFELWCVGTQPPKPQWKLEFSVRDEAE